MRGVLLLCCVASASALAEETIATNDGGVLPAASLTPAETPAIADGGVEEPANWEPITWGELDPGRGFRVAKTELGDLWISGYAVVRYINQLPAEQTYVDHLGRERVVDTRHDVSFHRALLNFRGFLFLKKFEYVLTMWTVLASGLFAFIGTVTYRFHDAFNLSVGVDGMPGIRTLLGSHPYWLGHDRTMAEETMRPGFTNALFATGKVLPGLNYKISFGNNISQLDITAAQLTRDFTIGGSVWWMPTTKEFGPRGGSGDWENHEQVALRFGASSVRAIEDHYTPLDQPPGSTQIRLADGVPLFETGALAPGVTLQKATYVILSLDAGLKYRGFFLQAEFHNRWLYDFVGNGPVPVKRIVDQSFYVQGSFFPIPQKLEFYFATSMVFGDRAAGFTTQWEVFGGGNFYPANSRNFRLNTHIIYVDRASAGGTFGYYTAGEKGPIVTVALSFLF